MVYIYSGHIQFAPLRVPALTLPPPDEAVEAGGDALADAAGPSSTQAPASIEPSATSTHSRTEGSLEDDTPKPSSPTPPACPPLPASPKSVYQLAHLLDLPDLQTLALTNLKAQLTSDNVVYQLTTDIALHEPVREALVAFAAANWAAVRQSPVMTAFQQPGAFEGCSNPGLAASSVFALLAKCNTAAV